MSNPALPPFPALFQSVPASAARRIVRTLVGQILVWGISIGAAIALSATLFAGWPIVSQWYLTALALAAVLSLLMVFWASLSGRWFADLMVGVRTVRVSDGGRPGVRYWARAAVTGVISLVSLGVGGLLLALIGRDEQGRTWPDRLAGVATIDVRRGRDVLDWPVSEGELRDHFRVRQAAGPAIITVDPHRFSAGTMGVTSPPVGTAVRPAPSVAPPPAPRGGAGWGQPPAIDDRTMQRPLPGQSAPAPAAAAAAGPDPVTWLLIFDTGQRHLLQGAAVLGRKPQPLPNHRGAHLVAVNDPSSTVSTTHLLVIANELGIWVEDLGSTNGSEVLHPNGRGKALPARSRVALAPGSRVRIGDRVISLERSGT